MMTPKQVTFYVYADDDTQVQVLQHALNAFVREMYNKGRLVTASGLSEALRRFGGNPLVTNYFKNQDKK